MIDRPNRWCAIDNIAAPVGEDQTTATEVQLPNTMEHLTLPLGCDFFSPNTNMQIHKRRFSLSAKEKKVRRDEKPSFVYLFCSKSDFFR